MKITDKYVFFWGGIFSNWANVPEGIKFTNPNTGENMTFESSEQLFMYLKACYFGDSEIAKKILETRSPKEAKSLGRKVRGFNEGLWEKAREEKMMIALKYKLASWPLFQAELLNEDYKGKTFVEASPYDKIWGIGLGEDNPEVNNKSSWRGLNLLGKLLTELRDSIK